MSNPRPVPGAPVLPPGVVAQRDRAGAPARGSRWPRTLRLLLANPSSAAGAVIVLGFLLTTAAGPYLVPYPEDAGRAVHPWDQLLPPSPAHWFGTDDVGRDVLSRVVAGSRISLRIGVMVTVLSALIGTPLGLVAAFRGGWVEEAIMRVTDIFLAVPGLVLAVAVNAALGPGIDHAMLALTMVWWPGYVRLVHGKAKALKEELFVEAARAVGVGYGRLLARHILPNAASTLLVKASMDMGMVILTAAGLGFVGVGATPPAPEWGAMISDGRRYLPNWWWASTFPGLAIYLTVLGFNLLGDGLRDVLDPRSRP